MTWSQWEHFDHDRGEYGYYTEDGTWHQTEKQSEGDGFY